MGVAGKTRGSRAGWVPESGRTDLGIPEETGCLCVESSGCAESPAGTGSLSARKNLPEQKRPPAQARLPALGHSFGGV